MKMEQEGKLVKCVLKERTNITKPEETELLLSEPMSTNQYWARKVAAFLGKGKKKSFPLNGSGLFFLISILAKWGCNLFPNRKQRAPSCSKKREEKKETNEEKKATMSPASPSAWFMEMHLPIFFPPIIGKYSNKSENVRQFCYHLVGYLNTLSSENPRDVTVTRRNITRGEGWPKKGGAIKITITHFQHRMEDHCTEMHSALSWLYLDRSIFQIDFVCEQCLLSLNRFHHTEEEVQCLWGSRSSRQTRCTRRIKTVFEVPHLTPHAVANTNPGCTAAPDLGVFPSHLNAFFFQRLVLCVPKWGRVYSGGRSRRRCGVRPLTLWVQQVQGRPESHNEMSRRRQDSRACVTQQVTP